MITRNLRFVEVASELGAGTRGSSLGMAAIRIACYKKQYPWISSFPNDRLEFDHSVLLEETPSPYAKWIEQIKDHNTRVAEHLQKVIGDGNFPFVISGDHSNALGTISGIKMSHPDKRLGVVWIDAHIDIHTPYTTPSGNVHGMPIGAALDLRNEGEGRNKPDEKTIENWNAFCSIGGIAPKVQPEDIVYIAIRDYEEEEIRIVEQHNIVQHGMDEIAQVGVINIAEETLSHLSDCDLIYVSFDIDSIDGRTVPGTGTPVPRGLSHHQALHLLREFWKSDKLAALEFSEVNPLLDRRNQTAEVAAELINELLH